MRYFTRSALCLLLALLFCGTVAAGPWVVAPEAELQSPGAFAPDRFADFAADGLWAAGYTIHGRQLRKPALVRFAADGQSLVRVFPVNAIGLPLRALADGGVVYATTVRGGCQATRLHADGRTAWQNRVGDGSCLALDIDATGAVWVAINQLPTPREISSRRIFQVFHLREDGSADTQVVFDDTTQNLFSMRADPLGGGVVLAGHRRVSADPQSARAQVLKLRADGSIEWQWQTGASATASSVKLLEVSASAGIHAVSSRFLPDGISEESKDWLVAGLSLGGVPRFDKQISFGKTVSIVGSSIPDAAGQWLTLHHDGSDPKNDVGEENSILWVVPIAVDGKKGDSSKIRNAYRCGSYTYEPCQMLARPDAGVWLLSNAGIIGVDSPGRERARLVSTASTIGALPDGRVLGVIGDGRYQVLNVQSVDFNRPTQVWSPLQAPERALAPVEAVASDGAVAQWLSVGERGSPSAASVLNYRSSDVAPVAWQVAFDFVGYIHLSISLHMVCLAGSGESVGPLRFFLECRRREDGGLLWADTRPAPPPPSLGPLIARFQAVAALDDGRAVAISSDRGRLLQWVIDADGAVLSERDLPLVDDIGAETMLSEATFNAEGDALLTAFFTGRNGVLLRLDHDGTERFKTAIGARVGYEPFVFADDGGAILSGTQVYGNGEPSLARYLATGEKAWELLPDRKVAELRVAGDTLVYSVDPAFAASGDSPRDWELVGLDIASGAERWRLPLGATADDLAGIALLDPQRVAVLQTEQNHLRYREVVVANGDVQREQTDDCGGAFCGCPLVFCRPNHLGQALVSIPRASAPTGVRLRARVGNVLPSSGWGSSVLLLDDAGQTPSSVRADQAGVNGTWFAPWASGQGLMLDWIADARTLFASWLTFAPDAGNDANGLRWYTLQGELADASADAPLDILLNEGGRFAAGVTTSRRVGSARLRFESCDRAQFSYHFDPDENDGLSGLVTLSRLVPADTCNDAPAAMPLAAIGEGIDGAWYEPASSGQGLVFDAITEADTLFATWFTYDPEGAADDVHKQHWFTLQGPLGTGEPSTLAIIRTIGGSLSERATANSQQVGVATLVRLGCDRLQLNYQFADSDIAGPFRGLSDSHELLRLGGCAE